MEKRMQNLLNGEEEEKDQSSGMHKTQKHSDALTSQEAQSLHNRLVVIQAVNYKKQGYTNIKVKNANNSQSQPDQVDGYIPDLSAILDSQTMICEVETNDSINDLSTVDKWKAFDNSGHQFHLIIPNDDFNQVKEIVKDNGISVDKYWCIKDY